MALMSTYLVTAKNLEALLNSLSGAKAPEKFTNKFLSDLGFASSNDRLYVSLFKGLGLVNENSEPTQDYFDLLDQTQLKKVLAKCTMRAYEDLFNLNKDANKMTHEEVKNKLKTLTQGKNSDKVYGLMATTFKALCDVSDFTKSASPTKKTEEDSVEDSLVEKRKDVNEPPKIQMLDKQEKQRKMPFGGLVYNIQIHLPDTRDEKVYEAIFSSLRKYLED